MTNRRRTHRIRAVDVPQLKAHQDPCGANPQRRLCVHQGRTLIMTRTMMTYPLTQIRIYSINLKDSQESLPTTPQ